MNPQLETALTHQLGLVVPAVIGSTTTNLCLLPDIKVSYCLTIRNVGSIPLGQHTVSDPLVGLQTSFLAPLQPGSNCLWQPRMSPI